MLSGQAVTAQDRAVTLNDRLNKMVETIGYQCDRIEAVLSRVNGAPQKIEQAKGGNVPRPTLSMQNAIEALENIQQRLIDLTNNVEKIA